MKFEKNNQNMQEVSADFLALCSEKFDVAPQIMEQIILRGNNTIEKIEEFLNPTQKSFLNPFDLDGMSELVARIKLAKETNENVLIFGDYDVDGISATAIMIKTLKIFGINNAKYFLPNRYVDGYGLTNEVVKKIKKLYNPSLIVTVDCGISCWEVVDFAKTLGIEIIVTDHHEIPEIIPKTIVVNAKLPNQKYAFSGLCGTGLAYKISQALIDKDAEQFLPIAAVATIADIVPLVSENRAIVTYGLKCLDKLPIGLKMLFKKLGLSLTKCQANDISFKIAPKINASGRMGDAQDSLKLYLSEDVEECKAQIEKILNHNDNRKDLCLVVEKDCENILSKVNLTAPSIILSSKDWDHGILGIICSKLVGQFNRPVFLFSEENGEMKGSARSIPGVNVHKLLSDMKDILEVFGGHPVAAGLTIKSSNFDKFVERVNDYLLKNFDDEIFIPKANYDLEVSVDELTPKFLKDLAKLEPCGCENETLRFMVKTSNFKFEPMKNYYNHCNIFVDKLLNLVMFDAVKDYPKLKYSNEIELIFELQTNQKFSSLKGTVKAINCQPQNLNNVGKMDVIPYLEQIRYLDATHKFKFTYYSNNDKILNPQSCFGTAFVVNSENGFKNFLKYVNQEKVIKMDICAGVENSGLNCLFLTPKNLGFVKFYNKIVFFDSIIEKTYLSKIAEISKPEIFIPKFSQPYHQYFSTINSSHENYGKIFNLLKQKQLKFTDFQDLFTKIKGNKNFSFNFKDFYSSLYVFEELGLLSFEKQNYFYSYKINSTIKTDLNNSKYFQKINTKN